MQLNEIYELQESLGIHPLSEALTKEQYDLIFQDLKFGLELECVCTDNDFLRVTNVIDYDMVDVFKTLSEDYLRGGSTWSTRLNKFPEKYRKPLTNFFKLFHTTGAEKGHIGSYHSGTRGSVKQGWRIEEDGSIGNKGMEVISPLNNGDLMDYYQAIDVIPKIVTSLKALGFKGTKATGLHINTSYKDKLNRRAFENLFTELSRKYSPFAVACALLTKETEVLWRMGSYNRLVNNYSKSFEAKLSDKFLEEMGSYMSTTILSNVYDSLKSQLNDRQMEALKSGELGYVFKLPVKPFVTGKMPIGFQWLNSWASSFIMNQQKYQELHIQSDRVELRGFGGAGAFDVSSSSDALGKALRAAATQLFPFIDPSYVDLKTVFRSVQYVLRDSVVPVLAAKFNFTGAVRLLGSDKAEERYSMNLNLGRGFTGFLEKSNLSNDQKEFFRLLPLTNVEVDPSASEIKGQLVKDLSQKNAIDLRDSTGASSMYTTLDPDVRGSNSGRVTLKGVSTSGEQIGGRQMSKNTPNYDYTSVYTGTPKLPKDLEITVTRPLELSVQPASQAPTPVQDPDPTNIQHNPNERTLTINNASFYLDSIKKPGMKVNVVAFDYEDGYRYKIKLATREDAQNLLNILTQYAARPQRGELAADRASSGRVQRYRWIA